jgi:hypothetical protein
MNISSTFEKAKNIQSVGSIDNNEIINGLKNSVIPELSNDKLDSSVSKFSTNKPEGLKRKIN